MQLYNYFAITYIAHLIFATPERTVSYSTFCLIWNNTGFLQITICQNRVSLLQFEIELVQREIIMTRQMWAPCTSNFHEFQSSFRNSLDRVARNEYVTLATIKIARAAVPWIYANISHNRYGTHTHTSRSFVNNISWLF